MGEKSKTIGELGENIQRGLANIFGWTIKEGTSISCNQRVKHNKVSHGIDSILIQKTPLIANSGEIGIVSVKNVQKGKEKSNFKKFTEDLIETTSCFLRDALFADYSSSLECKFVNEKRVLFWFTNDENDNYSLIGKISSLYPSTKDKFTQLTVIDNRTASFHYNLWTFVNNSFKTAESIEYFYPDTGLNESLSEARLLSGKQLPIDWLTSPIIPYKIKVDSNKNVLVLALNESFDEDSFRRLAGLSQSLTGGWCNKVFLCFPDYRYQEHKEVKEKVLMQFADQEFASMVDVWPIAPGFQTLEEENRTYFSHQTGKKDEKPVFNIERMLPYGDTLRQLLNQPYINKSDIVKVLNRRGVIVNKSQKKVELIPLLTTTFVSPSELEYLRRCQLSRANSERIASSNIVSTNQEAVQETVLSASFPVEEIVNRIAPHASVKSRPNFSIHPDGSIRMKIETKSQLVNKDWAHSNTNNTTEIIINKGRQHGGNIKARIDVIASSPENKKIGQHLVKAIEEEVKKNGVLRRDFTLEKTLANEYDNRKRAELLFSFFLRKIDAVTTLKFKDLKNVDFVISDSLDDNLQDDLLTLRDKVERSIFSGRNLQEIKYITEPKYYDFLVFTEVIADFFFTRGEMKGVFEVQYGFPDFDLLNENSDKSEFEFKITSLTPFVERNLTRKEMHDLESFLREEFAKLKQEAINLADKKYGKQMKIDL